MTTPDPQPPTEQAFRAAIHAHAGGMARFRASRRAQAAEDLHQAVVHAHRLIVDDQTFTLRRQVRLLNIAVSSARDDRDRARDTLAAAIDEHHGVVERLRAERDAAVVSERSARETLAAVVRERDQFRDVAHARATEASQFSRAVTAVKAELSECRAERDRLREQVDDVRIAIVDITAEKNRLKDQAAEDVHALTKAVAEIASLREQLAACQATGPLCCPRCDSPDPKLHPAMQAEGEAQPCPHPWHKPAPATDPAPGPRSGVRPEPSPDGS